MGKNSFSLILTITGALFLFLSSPAWALIKLHDIRYTLYPDPFIPDRAFISASFQTKWQADGSFIGSTQFGINDRFEVGGKIFTETERRFEKNTVLLNLGTKIALFEDDFVQIDGIVGINSNPGTSLIFSYGKLIRHTSKIQNIFEARIAFFGDVVNNEWTKIELGAHPSLQITDAGILRLGAAMGTTIKHPIKSFNLYIFPGFQLKLFSHLSLMGEYAINITGNNPNRIALHLTSLF
ncbi:MAG: hypothetical protein GX801_02675 [Fibrobacter sp.]|nr:hypothetical protein [Fibrobacter sp.]